MNNKSLKALTLLAIFSVSIAGAAVQLAPEKAPTTKQIKKKGLSKRLAIAKANGLLG